MGEGVAAHLVPVGQLAPDQCRIAGHPAADVEERRRHAFGPQHAENLRRPRRVGTVVERQRDRLCRQVAGREGRAGAVDHRAVAGSGGHLVRSPGALAGPADLVVCVTLEQQPGRDRQRDDEDQDPVRRGVSRSAAFVGGRHVAVAVGVGEAFTLRGEPCGLFVGCPDGLWVARGVPCAVGVGCGRGVSVGDAVGCGVAVTTG